MKLKLKLAPALALLCRSSASRIESGTNSSTPADIQVFQQYVDSLESEDYSHNATRLVSVAAERSLTSCGADEILFKLDLTTDDNGSQSRWSLKISRHRNIILQGPAAGQYESNTNYIEEVCLSPGDYIFKMLDSGKDGIKSPGRYDVYIDGVKKFGSRRTMWRKRVHRFTIAAPSPSSTPMPSPQSCSPAEKKVKIELRTDAFAGDTSFEVVDQGKTLIKSDRVYQTLCLEKGRSYDFTLRDKVGDGLGSDGYFKVSIYEDDSNSWREVVSIGQFRSKEFTYKINLKEVAMTTRDQQWLESHNRRREKWHTLHGKSYVPLKWSESLKDDAQVWANKLLDSCGSGMWHDPDNYQYGENVAGNVGSGSWGEKKSTEDILTRFVEREEDKPYPQNGHLTQVLWRSSKFVGCAEASKPYKANGMCHTQVCRYSRSGNCNMNKYKSAKNDQWWLEPMLLDDTPCGYDCPPDGCS